MITRTQLKTLQSQYNPGGFRKFSAFFGGSGQSDNMKTLSTFTNSIKTEVLSADNMQELERILLLEKDGKSETFRIFRLIKNEIETAKKAQIEKQKNEWLLRALHAALKTWTNSYYVDRSKSLVLAANEMALFFSKSNTTYIEHGIGILFLIFSCYGIKYSDYSFIAAGKIPHIINYFFTESISHTHASPIRDMNPILRWFIGLGLQLGIDFMTGIGGAWVASYVVGTLFEVSSNYLFDAIRLKIKTSQKPSYPHTEILLKKILGDLAFCGGSILGQHVHYRVQNQVQEPLNHAEALLIKLTDDENKLLFNERECKSHIKECHAVALKVLQLDPKKMPSKKDIKSAYRALSLMWHPDRIKNKIAEEQMAIINAADYALKI